MNEKKPLTPELLQQHKALLEGGLLAVVQKYEELTGTTVRSIYLHPEGKLHGARCVYVTVRLHEEPGLPTYLKSERPGAGFLEVGLSEDWTEVIVNHPALLVDEHGVGHIVFSPKEAIHLGNLLLKKASECKELQK